MSSTKKPLTCKHLIKWADNVQMLIQFGETVNPIPCKALQIVPDGVITVFIRNQGDQVTT